MGTVMRTLIYGTPCECSDAADAMRRMSRSADCEFRFVYSLESLPEQLAAFRPGLFVVLKNGAAGMEGVYCARRSQPDLPLFWFSDDCGFGMQSHRLECDYFAVKPFTTEKLQKAMRRCDALGIHLRPEGRSL